MCLRARRSGRSWRRLKLGACCAWEVAGWVCNLLLQSVAVAAMPRSEHLGCGNMAFCQAHPHPLQPQLAGARPWRHAAWSWRPAARRWLSSWLPRRRSVRRSAHSVLHWRRNWARRACMWRSWSSSRRRLRRCSRWAGRCSCVAFLGAGQPSWQFRLGGASRCAPMTQCACLCA